MPNKIIAKENNVSIRLDGAYISGKNYFINPYINDEGKERYFGNFKFTNFDEAKATLNDVVKILRKTNPQLQDSIFYGDYPKWVEDSQYGIQFKVGNKVGNRLKFFKSIGSNEEIEPSDIENYVYALEIHFNPTKANDIFMRVVRAIAIAEIPNRFNDDLFEGDTIEISDDDLPF